MPMRLLQTFAVLLVLGLTVPARPSGAAAGETQEHGFVDFYGGGVRLFEADVPGSSFADVTPTVGTRAGVWLGPNWGLTFRVWYFQTDAKLLGSSSPSDLAFLGLSLELLARWQLTGRWAVYGTGGPVIAVTSLDRQRDPASRIEDDARSVAPGVSAALGSEVRVFRQLRAFIEIHGAVAYPEFRFPSGTIVPRLGTLHALAGLRLGF